MWSRNKTERPVTLFLSRFLHPHLAGAGSASAAALYPSCSLLPALYDLAVLKKKVKEKEEKKKKKIKIIKSEAEDLVEPLSGPERLAPLSEAPSPLADPAIKEE